MNKIELIQSLHQISEQACSEGKPLNMHRLMKECLVLFLCYIDDDDVMQEFINLHLHCPISLSAREIFANIYEMPFSPNTKPAPQRSED